MEYHIGRAVTSHEFGDGQFYLSHIGGCIPGHVIRLICCPVVPWPQMRIATDCLGGSNIPEGKRQNIIYATITLLITEVTNKSLLQKRIYWETIVAMIKLNWFEMLKK
jgi:hypothetical protein